jgi:hypothetical protein
VCGRELGEPPYAVQFDGEMRVRLVIPGSGTVLDHWTLDELVEAY